ncbi:MAG: thioredoxin family protein [Calothrix sp. C42_A2020_038]|nr:thioredoxin family protein [Calothrix sp. C42_A2020_038]
MSTVGCEGSSNSANQTNSTDNSAPQAQSSPVSQNTETQAVRVGSPAPTFTAVDSNGKSHSLSDFKGKTVVLEWTNHECPFVKKHYDSNNMQALQKEKTGKGVVWLSVISSAPGQQGNVTPQKANELTKSRNANPTAVLIDTDGKVGRLYQARTTPHMYVIDSNGVLQYMGAIDDNPSKNPEDVKTANNYVRAAVDSVLKGEAVKTSTTQPYGCSVKYAS